MYYDNNNSNDPLKDLVRMTVVALVCILLTVFLLSSVAHCTDQSQQTSQELLCMYIKHCNHKLDQDTIDTIAYEVVSQSRDTGIPYEIIAAIMKTESYYDPAAVGPKGEIGLMQIYTMQCGDIEIHKELLFDIEYNITAGICIFLDKLIVSDGDLVEAIRRYNGSGLAAEKFARRVCKVVIDILRFRVANRKLQRRRRVLSARDL